MAILHDVPLDILKADRAFIDEVGGDERRRAFTAASGWEAHSGCA